MAAIVAVALVAIIVLLRAVFAPSQKRPAAQPATAKQKAFARELGIHYHPRISVSEMSHLIGQALEQREADNITRLQNAAAEGEMKRERIARERELAHETKARDRSHLHDLELLERKLADIRSGKPESKATLAQKEIANRYHVIFAVDSTKKEIGDALEEKLNQMRGEFEQSE
jgi:hypothetical protein